MAQGLEIDLRLIVLQNGPFGPQEIGQLSEAIAGDSMQCSTLREAVNELKSREDPTPASMVRLGVCHYLLGKFQNAIDALGRADGGALALFYLAKAKAAVEAFAEAIGGFEAAKNAGYDADQCLLAIAEAHRSSGNLVAALAVLDGLSGAVEQTADYLSQRAATVAALGGNPSEVVALYERAIESEGTHPGALFGLALENDRHGNDGAALELYRRASERSPTHVGTLLNLGLLYEDQEQYTQAAQCYERILAVYPNHREAALFLKDTEASSDQYYDEDVQKKRERISQVLSIPVTDFELSVRSRNCLQKMGIAMLGDLCRCTEQELLSSKNFGETSLVEIREMLASKGLRLGQIMSERQVPEPVEPESYSPDQTATFARPISELSLSVRARKCMIRLGINTFGDLLRRTGDDLLECKNFGVTSLNEVREKLALDSLKLRGE